MNVAKNIKPLILLLFILSCKYSEEKKEVQKNIREFPDRKTQRLLKKNNLGTIKKILCDQEIEKRECELKGLSSKFNFTIRGLEFEDEKEKEKEKEKRKPVSVLITSKIYLKFKRYDLNLTNGL